MPLGFITFLGTAHNFIFHRVTTEAGGNAPFIVFDDADISAAVDGAMASKFRQGGQTCVCANRVYVHSSVYADFASKLAEKVDKFKVSNCTRLAGTTLIEDDMFSSVMDSTKKRT